MKMIFRILSGLFVAAGVVALVAVVGWRTVGLVALGMFCFACAFGSLIAAAGERAGIVKTGALNLPTDIKPTWDELMKADNVCYAAKILIGRVGGGSVVGSDGPREWIDLVNASRTFEQAGGKMSPRAAAEYARWKAGIEMTDAKPIHHDGMSPIATITPAKDNVGELERRGAKCDTATAISTERNDDETG